jgi:phosphomannomutase
MVTASHNPPHDNGYKVYLASGAQIVPPIDAAIAARIADAPSIGAILRLAPLDAAAAGLRRIVDEAVEDAYLDGLAAGALHLPEPVPLRIVYTAMHGVGHRLVIRAFRRAGFEGIAAVPAQCDPDGSFRTVPFPNPEEPGAMDLALTLARETTAELILANDPDADRLGAAVREGDGYRMLTGNEIGVLLADDAMEHTATGGRPKLVVTTVVSSSLLSRMARDRGVEYAETLTGFKWIADAALRAEARGRAFVFGYEEALGYTCGPLVRDKDGIGAALRLAELARFLKARGQSLTGRLDDLLLAHGLSHQVQWSAVLSGRDGRTRIDVAMAALRARPLEAIGASPVVRIVDTKAGIERTRDGREQALTLPPSDVLAFHAEDGARLVARPSGTEPKLKFYLELVGQAADRAGVAPVRGRLEAEGQAFRRALMERLNLA